MIDKISYPGQEFEKAGAEITSAAGKSLVRSLGRIVDSWSLNKSADLKAKAQQKLLDVKHAGEIRRAKEQNDFRRIQEIEELDHMRALTERALGRLKTDLEAEQRIVEQIIDHSVKKIEEKYKYDEARDIDADWLRIFFNYASKVTEQQLMDVLSQALADAAVRGKPIIPNKALDSLRFFDQNSIECFKFVAKVLSRIGSANDNYLEKAANRDRIIFSIDSMEELGLIKYDHSYYRRIRIGNFYLIISCDIGSLFRFDSLKLTQAGQAIASLFNPTWKKLIESYPFGLPDDEFWEAQKDAGIDEIDAEILARTILSEVCDMTRVEFEIFRFENSRMMDVYKVERLEIDQPFGFFFDYEHEISSQNKLAIESFINVFNEFDQTTSKKIRRKDQ